MLTELLMATSMAVSQHTKIIDFTEAGEANKWFIVNDTVMGGLSTANVSTSGGQLILKGTLSLANNGGFASARRIDTKIPHQTKTIKIRVKADGRDYQFRLRTTDSWNRIAYGASFSTLKNSWTEASFRLEDFKPTFRGREVLSAPPLEFSRVGQLTLMIADKRQGDFFLTLDSIQFLD